MWRPSTLNDWERPLGTRLNAYSWLFLKYIVSLKNEDNKSGGEESIIIYPLKSSLEAQHKLSPPHPEFQAWEEGRWHLLALWAAPPTSRSCQTCLIDIPVMVMPWPSC